MKLLPPVAWSQITRSNRKFTLHCLTACNPLWRPAHLANVRLALALMSVDEVTHYRQRCVSVGMWPASDR